MITALLLTGDAVAQEPCEVANALLNATLYEKAQANYTDLLMKYPNLTCAQDGIVKAQSSWAINLYEIGQAYENASQFEKAREQYVDALKKDPSYIPAQVALEKVSDDKFAAVQTLANLGYYTEAAVRLKKVIEDNPGINVPRDLEYLPGRSIFLWGDIRDWIEIWGQPLAEIVIFVLGLYILRWRIWPWIKGVFFKPKLDIKAFDKGATDMEIGTGMMAMVEGSLMQIGQELGHGYVHIVTEGYDNKIPADIKGTSTRIKMVSNLIEWIFPSSVITISGYLEKPGSCGAGLTLSMVNSQTGEILGNTTIWQKDYDTIIKLAEQSVVEDKRPSSYYCLVEPAAIWAFFQLRSHSKIKKGISYEIWEKIRNIIAKDTEKFALLGTDVWNSYAYFRAGVRWELEGKKDKARRLYVEAQNQDMNNYGALLNLGYLDIEDKNYDRAIERLSMAKKMADKYLFSWDEIPGNDSERLTEFLNQSFNIDWVDSAKIEKIDNDKTIKVYRDTNYLSLNLNNGKNKVTLRIDDGRTGEFIVKEENHELNIYETSKKFRGDAVWYIATYQLAAAYHYKSIKLRDDDGRAKVDKDKAKKFLNKAEKEARNLLKTIHEEKFLESIEPNANIMHASILVDLAYQCPIDQSKINEAKLKIDSMERMYSKLAPRVRYNLACYYSILGDHSIVGDKTNEDNKHTNYKKALDNLEYAIEGGGDIIQWAKIDPSLKGVRKFKETEVDFAELIKKYEQKYDSQKTSDSTDLLPLAGLTIIKEAFAKQLKEQGIVSPCDLIMKADTLSAREELAKKLGISTILLLRWALLADLMRIVKDTKQINLLEAADYGSIEALRKARNPCELADLLNQVNKVQSLVEQSPSCETVQKWLQEARKTKLMVVDNHSVII